MRIGLFGGTFDPIHVGHLVLATIAMEEGHLDQVLFMPAKIPPHKVGKEIAAPEHRLEMVKLATSQEHRFEVSDWELRQEQVSYTIDTVTWLADQHPNDELFFIVGADMLADFPTWQEPERILELVTLLAVPRPGFFDGGPQAVWEQLPASFQKRIQILNTPELEIASTWIRDRIQSGKSIHYIVPRDVEQYILQNELYGYSLKPDPQAEKPIDWSAMEERIRQRLQQELSPYRQKHVEGVVATAEKLAKDHGISVEKIRVAAWLHDLAREWPADRLIEYGKRLHVEQAFFQATDLLHGPIAAKLAPDWFGLDDPDILQAVKYHTCGREGMSVFEKVLCLADAIEPGRDYPGVDVVREAAEESLEKALALQFDGTISFLLARKKPICIDTMMARNEWWSMLKQQQF